MALPELAYIIGLLAIFAGVFVLSNALARGRGYRE
jgi:hypothetical protein